MDANSEIKGVIYPINKKNLSKLKRVDNPMYIKYLPHGKSKNPTKLESNNFLFYYLSGGEKTIVGYSKINDIKFKMPEAILENYIDRIQMSRKEFDEYTKERKGKELLTLFLEDFLIFSKPVKTNYHVTMAGKYLTEEEIKNEIDLKSRPA